MKQGRRSSEGKGGGGGNRNSAAELSLVCFPSRTNLSTLMPNKPICSPGHSTDTTKRHHRHHHHHHHKGGRASPLFWSKTKPEINEPTSPKVTCAGNIKVSSRPKSITSTTTSTNNSRKNGHSVMEEIERNHHNNNRKVVKIKKQRRRPTSSTNWMVKKDKMQVLLTSLRSSIRFNLGCFGAFNPAAGSHITSCNSVDIHEEVVVVEAEEDHQEENKQNQLFCLKQSNISKTGANSRSTSSVFSKWFRVLQENKNSTRNADQFIKKEEKHEEETEVEDGFGGDEGLSAPPPPNALLLMRCKTLPARSWLEEKEEEAANKAELVLEEEKKKQKLVLRCYQPEFFKVSSGNKIEKKTNWVVGGIKQDPFSRSQSWKA